MKWWFLGEKNKKNNKIKKNHFLVVFFKCFFLGWVFWVSFFLCQPCSFSLIFHLFFSFSINFPSFPFFSLFFLFSLFLIHFSLFNHFFLLFSLFFFFFCSFSPFSFFPNFPIFQRWKIFWYQPLNCAVYIIKLLQLMRSNDISPPSQWARGWTKSQKSTCRNSYFFNWTLYITSLATVNH